MDIQNIAIGLTIGLLIGVGVGYGISVSRPSNIQDQINSLQSQISTLQNQISSKDATISTLQQQVKDRDATISSLQKAVSDRDATIANLQKQLTPQSGTYFRISSVRWEISDGIIRIFISNTGSEIPVIESVKIARGSTSSGAIWYTDETPGPLIFPGDSGVYVWKLSDSNAPSNFLTYGTSYLIKVTCTTGYSDTEVYTSPAS